MAESAHLDTKDDIAFESFGVRVLVSSDAPEVLERVPALLPPDAQPCPASAVEELRSIAVVRRAGGSYDFLIGGSPVTTSIDLDFALTLLEAQLRIIVGLHAPNRIFVHAGAVAHEGRVIVIPGLSMAGKTTLVAALVRAGAVYYSDEFAVLDERGLVHPYAKPLSVRDGALAQSDRSVESFGGVIGEEPLPIGAIIFTHYQTGAEWMPTRLSPGRAVLAMFENTLAASTRPGEAIRVIKRAIGGGGVLLGGRGGGAPGRPPPPPHAR